MAEPRPASSSTYQLQLLPKEKRILDFVLKKLSESLSPERFEVAEAIFTMYRTSAGFDPRVMAKVRFKRLKAGDFKEAFVQIDQEIGQIIQSQDYRHELVKLGGPEPLFQSFSELVQEAGSKSASAARLDIGTFEAKCSATDTIELMLLFYRQNARLVETLYQQEDANSFLERYDSYLERFRQVHRQFRISFEIKMLEHSSESSMSEQDKVGDLLQELGALLTVEKEVTKRAILLSLILRASALTPAPAVHIRPYLPFLERDIDHFFPHYPDSRRYVLSVLAHYHIDAGTKARLQWLEEADKLAKAQEQLEDRVRLRLIRAAIEADNSQYQSAWKILNEVEQLLFKCNAKSNITRNNWVKTCELKTLLACLNQLSGGESDPTIFEQVQQHASEMGRHRHDIAVSLLEWRGLEHLLGRRFEDALNCFNKALDYRSGQLQHPWNLMNRFFVAMLEPEGSRAEAATQALHLQELQEPFYSKVGTELMRLVTEVVNTKDRLQKH